MICILLLQLPSLLLSQCETQKAEMQNRLPPEITTDVLSRLPVDSLLRFRSLSKFWCEMIDSPGFVKTHLTKSIETRSNLTLLFAEHSEPNFLYKVRFDSLNAVVKLDNALNREEYTISHFPKFIGLNPHQYMQTLGSCNGLVCLSNAYHRLLILNPSIRKYKAVPLEPSLGIASEAVSRTFGFGYDPDHDDYKVVKIAHYFSISDNYFHAAIMVYDLKVDAWRELQDFPYLLFLESYELGTFVGRSLNWLAVVGIKNSNAIYGVPNLILGFDLGREEYRELALPDEVSRSKFDSIRMRVVGEWLSVVVVFFKERYDFWVMKEYGVVESWTKLISFEVNKLPAFIRMNKFYFSADENELLLELLPGYLVWYNLKEKCIKKVKVDGIVRPIVGETFHESLVSLGLPDVEKESGTSMKKRDDEDDDFLSKGLELVL